MPETQKHRICVCGRWIYDKSGNGDWVHCKAIPLLKVHKAIPKGKK